MAEDKKPAIIIKTHETLFDVVIYEFCPTQKYIEGDNENNIRIVALGCNYAGIEQNEAIKLISDRYRDKCNIDELFIRPIVETIYQEYLAEHASKAIMFSIKVRNKFDDEDWQKLPYIPDEVYLHLPDILRKGTEKFSDKRERDVFLTGALGVISGMLQTVKGIYMGSEVYPNLFCFIVAPAGSGKGALVFAKQIGMPYHYAVNEYSNGVLTFIPANISSAAINQQINKNGGWGIIIETEADSMAFSFKQDWGGYSDILRKAYHHEPIEMKRKDNDLYIEVPKPRLSVILSGTFNQVRGIIKNTEDGLFSRFAFYTYKADAIWKILSETKVSNNAFFEIVGNELKDIIDTLLTYDMEIHLTSNQLDIFNSRFSKWMNDFDLYMDSEALSIIKRQGLMLFRIVMILTALRKAENQTLNREEPLIYCEDEDFQTASMLVETYIHHAIFIYKRMNNDTEAIDTQLQLFYDSLPLVEFNRATAIQIGNKRCNIADRTVDKYLKKLVRSKYLAQPHYGIYKKI